MNNSDKPLAAEGLRIYRYRGRYGLIMIGATDKYDAMREVARSMDDLVQFENLDVWKDGRYQPVTVVEW